MSIDGAVSDTGRVTIYGRRGDYADKWKHVQLSYLITSEEDFIVGLDKDGDIDWETTPEYDKKGHKDARQHNAILNDAALLEATPCDGVRADKIKHFKRLIGEAIVRSLSDDYSSAEKMLSEAKTYISSRNFETSRLWYLSASALSTVPFVLLGCVLWFCRTKAVDVLGTAVFWFALSAVAGSLGALLSVTTRAGELRFDSSAGRALHFLEAASRIGTGALSGAIVALAVHTEVILAPLSRGDKMTAVMMLAAFAGGSAERLATSIISKFTASDRKGTREENRPEKEPSDD